MFLKEYSICPKITISIDYNPVALSFIPFDVPVNQMCVQLNPCSTYQCEPWCNCCLQGSSRKQEQIIDIKNCINFQDYCSCCALERQNTYNSTINEHHFYDKSSNASRSFYKNKVEIFKDPQANFSELSRNDDSENEKQNQKRDMVNYKILEGHEYEIIDNPDKDNCINKRLYICKYDDCNKTFTKTWNLVSHFRIHTNEKPYQCRNCLKTFTQRSNLSRHIQIHCNGKNRGNMIYRCTECPRKYSSKYNLNSHLKKVHSIGKEERKYKISTTNSIFDYRNF